MEDKSLPIIDPDSGQESLEDSSTGQESMTPVTSEDSVTNNNSSSPSRPPQKKLWNKLLGVFNVYVVLLLLVVVIAGGVAMVAFLQGRKASNATTISSQSLSQSTFEQLANTSASVGNTNQVLTVQSSAIFAGKVLARQDLEVAGNLQIGGVLAINDLAVAGGTSLQGAVTIAKSLQVNGSGNFGGPLSAPQVITSNLQLNGDLTLTHHLNTGGATPAKTDGLALGGGGTSSVSGNDSTGAVTINTGNNPPAGCFITVNFNSKYASTPRILVTPVGSSAGGLNYYVNRTNSNFSICDSTAPPATTSFGFDYFVLD